MQPVIAGLISAAAIFSLVPGSTFAPGPGTDMGLVQEIQARDGDGTEDEWDRGADKKGRPAASEREQRAFQFIVEYYRRATESTPDAYRFMAAAYAPEVSYYGKKRSREGVLADKFAWMERWPVRDYRVQEDSAEWKCNPSARLCVVRVLIDFDARNPATGKVSRGLTTNELGVSVTNSEVQIEYENGKVLSRR